MELKNNVSITNEAQPESVQLGVSFTDLTLCFYQFCNYSYKSLQEREINLTKLYQRLSNSMPLKSNGKFENK
jgi:hypothetical protein